MFWITAFPLVSSGYCRVHWPLSRPVWLKPKRVSNCSSNGHLRNCSFCNFCTDCIFHSKSHNLTASLSLCGKSVLSESNMWKLSYAISGVDIDPSEYSWKMQLLIKGKKHQQTKTKQNKRDKKTRCWTTANTTEEQSASCIIYAWFYLLLTWLIASFNA